MRGRPLDQRLRMTADAALVRRERDRGRFLPAVVVDASPWRIARMVARELRGESGEGLRGIFVPSGRGPGTIHWWPSHLAAHPHGAIMLGIHRPDGRRDPSALEVEADVGRDGLLYLAWPAHATDPIVEAFLAHPSIGELVDGCLTLRGRPIRIDADGVPTTSAVAPDAGDVRAERTARRRAAWDAMGMDADAWMRSRAPSLPDGRPMPPRDALRPYARWLRSGWRSDGPVPAIRFEDGAIVLAWRGADRLATMTFRDDAVSLRTVARGLVQQDEAGPVGRGRLRFPPEPGHLHRYRCALEGPR